MSRSGPCPSIRRRSESDCPLTDRIYFRPLVQQDAARPAGAVALAGGPLWFTHLEALSRTAPPSVVSVSDVPAPIIDRLTAPRPSCAGLSLDAPVLMGILNTTPDSFSDGGAHVSLETAVAAALRMAGQGAAIIDVGGESTRPGAATVPVDEEIRRTEPVIATLSEAADVPISIDTRKQAVARAALGAGAALINDVSGFTFDPDLAELAVETQTPVCIMHALGDPATMQDDPTYDDVLLDVFDFLEARIAALETLGLPRQLMVADPGIGFGKTVAHNLTLLKNLSLFHTLGVPLLLGASRKGFIGKIGQAPEAHQRAPGSIAVGLAALAQGVHILRVHDVAEMSQATRLWRSVR